MSTYDLKNPPWLKVSREVYEQYQQAEYFVLADDCLGMDANGQCNVTIKDRNDEWVADIVWDDLPSYPDYPEGDWLESYDPDIQEKLIAQAFREAGWHLPQPIPDAPWYFPTKKVPLAQRAICQRL